MRNDLILVLVFFIYFLRTSALAILYEMFKMSCISVYSVLHISLAFQFCFLSGADKEREAVTISLLETRKKLNERTTELKMVLRDNFLLKNNMLAMVSIN